MDIFFIMIIIIIGVIEVIQIYAMIKVRNTETQSYSIIRKEKKFEIRYYPTATMATFFSDLRNYNEVLKNCQVGEPVFLTKNGRGRFVVMDIEDYERDKAEKKLLEKLQEAEAAVKDGKGWLSLDELKTMVGE